MTFSSLLVRKALCLHYRVLCVFIILLCATIGDAVLAFWPCDNKCQQQMVTNVMLNVLSVQKKCDNFKVDEEINFRMKIAISIGDIFIYHLGMIP